VVVPQADRLHHMPLRRGAAEQGCNLSGEPHEAVTSSQFLWGIAVAETSMMTVDKG